MCVADAMDFGIARIIVDDVYNTMTVLKDAGYVCQITKVLTIEMQDEPGALSKILDLLGKEGINLEYKRPRRCSAPPPSSWSARKVCRESSGTEK